VTAWVGIDPGQTGGLALISGAELLDVVPMPVIDKEVMGGQIAEILRAWRRSQEEISVCIEQVGSMPKQGVASTFKFGKSFGIALGVVSAMGLPMVRMRPQKWRGIMGLPTPANKNHSRLLSTELWPSMSEHWKLKNQDGKAEAALIAEAARRTL
jgi:crossover junction endodeoxyribonuclease RuvC